MMTTTATPKHKRGEEGKEKNLYSACCWSWMDDFFFMYLMPNMRLLKIKYLFRISVF